MTGVWRWAGGSGLGGGGEALAVRDWRGEPRPTGWCAVECAVRLAGVRIYIRLEGGEQRDAAFSGAEAVDTLARHANESKTFNCSIVRRT